MKGAALFHPQNTFRIASQKNGQYKQVNQMPCKVYYENRGVLPTKTPIALQQSQEEATLNTDRQCF